MSDNPAASQDFAQVKEEISVAGMRRQRVGGMPVIYASSIDIAYSVFDFMITLTLHDPTGPASAVAHEVGRVILSPQHAKAFGDLLRAKVEEYERRFGPLPTGEVQYDESSSGG